ncbi:MAG: DeoR family transcriptional regulator, aga operon transcriptional repressor [Mycobacterium sp.]|nr:DeoR family transcriptional regulator, aga operon transcriptional repressor [Mycobacterium sp.]
MPAGAWTTTRVGRCSRPVIAWDIDQRSHQDGAAQRLEEVDMGGHHAVGATPQAVALTGGVTTGEVARALKGRQQMTIVTNSLTIAVDCAVDAL